MTEGEARDWVAAKFGVSAVDRLDRYVRLLLAESERQSLIARSTFATVWSRHIVDSAQLVLGQDAGLWLDIGSGGGLPGVVVALLRDDQVTLIEPRRKRAEFLRAVAANLKLRGLCTVQAPARAYEGPTPTVVSARAVAPLDDIFRWTRPFVSRETTYLLPRGRTGLDDLVIATRSWQGRFHVEPSLTDPAAVIIVAREVTAK